MLKRVFGVLLLAFSCGLVLPACTSQDGPPVETEGPAVTANQVSFHVPGMW